MPRTARIDHPGLTHHVVARGVERRSIFRGDRDRGEFVERLASLVRECETDCFAWALMPNHFHLVVRIGKTPLRTLMARLNGGYATWFNLRHGRSGHLFQNRYYAEPILSEEHFLCAIRYVHRNPIAAGLVSDLAALAGFPWSGHRALLGCCEARFEAVDEVLAHFADAADCARERLLDWMETAEEAPTPTSPMDDWVRQVVPAACARFSIDPGELRSGARRRPVSCARAVAAHLACDVMGIAQARVARELGMSEAGVYRARVRGRGLLGPSRRGESQEVKSVP